MHNSSQDYGAKLVDPDASRPQTPILASQYLAREMVANIVNEMALGNYDWDGMGHDWCHDTPAAWIDTANRSGTTHVDFDRNNVADQSQSINVDFQQATNVKNWILDHGKEYFLIKDRGAWLYYNPGTVATGPTQFNILSPHISCISGEAWVWNKRWYDIHFNMWRYQGKNLGGYRATGYFHANWIHAPFMADATYLPLDQGSVNDSSATADTQYGNHTDPKRRVNLKNKANAFRVHRYNITFSCIWDGMVDCAIHGHRGDIDVDEYASDLGQPVTLPWRIAKGPVGTNRTPNQTPVWPYTGAIDSNSEPFDKTNLYGAVYIRFFQKGVVIHYCPRLERMTTVNLTTADLQAAALALGHQAPENYYYMKAPQAPIQLYVGASQVRSENEYSTGVNGWGRATTGTWNATNLASWHNTILLDAYGLECFWHLTDSGSSGHIQMALPSSQDRHPIIPCGHRYHLEHG